MNNQTYKDEPWADPAQHRKFDRETWEGKNRVLSELEIFGWLKFQQAGRGFLRPDRHSDHFELHYIVKGHPKWWVEGESFETRPGTIFIVRPNELHWGDQHSLQPCEELWMRIQFPEGMLLPGLNLEETRFLGNFFRTELARCFSCSSELSEYWHKLHEAHRQHKPSSVILCRGLLHALLATIVTESISVGKLGQEKRKVLLTHRIRKAIVLLDEYEDARISLDQIASQVGLSPTGFRARFKAETGYTPHDYLIERSITKAAGMLAQRNKSITEIAMELGFSSSQYFATVFRRLVGFSPKEYRNSCERNAGQSV